MKKYNRLKIYLFLTVIVTLVSGVVMIKNILPSKIVIPEDEINRRLVEVNAQQTSSVQQTTVQLPKRKILFVYFNSRAKDVSIVGDFNDWIPQTMEHPNKKMWKLTLELSPGNYKYCFIVDGRVIVDPFNKNTADSGRGFLASVLKVQPRQDE